MGWVWPVRRDEQADFVESEDSIATELAEPSIQKKWQEDRYDHCEAEKEEGGRTLDHRRWDCVPSFSLCLVNSVVHES